MSSEEKQVVVNISSSKEYMLPSNHGEVSVDTTTASTSFQHTSANSDNVSQVRFDVPIGKNLAMSKNIKLKFRAKFLCRANIPLTVLPADVTSLDWKQAMGDFSDISFAPGGILAITDTMSFSYGTGNTLTISNPSEQLQLILACTNKNIIDKSLSDCMLKPDLKYSYDLEDTVADFNVAGLKNEPQWLRRSSTFDSPFSGTDDSEWGSRLPAYSIDIVNTSGVNSLTHFYLNVDLHTFIPSSLFNTKNSYTGTNFFGIEKFNLNMNLRSVYGKLFSFKPNSTQRFEAERMTFSEKPELTTTVYTPPSFIQDHIRSDDGSIKDYMVGFSYLDNVCNDNISGSVAPRASRVGYSYNSISIPTLPKRLYIGVISNMDIPLHGSLDGHEMAISQKTRTFARIDSAVLTINGTRSLVGARSEELYKMSVENGLERTYDEAMFLSGAPLVVDCRKDCSLANMLVGNSDSCNIGVDLSFTNLHTSIQNYFKLVVLAEYDSVLIHEKGNFKFQHANVVSALSGLSVSDIKPHNSEFYQSDGIYLGGGIFGDIKDGLQSAGKWVINHAPQIGTAIKTGVDVVRTLRGGKNEMIGGSTLKDTRFR